MLRKYFFIWLTCAAYSVNGLLKSSLTFVIDDTGSMTDDISEVKKAANSIFDTVIKSNASQIEDFVLVTFNDPGFKHRTTTKNKAQFTRALDKIYVDGGGDCPEMAIAGIELALTKSRPASYLYIFTDASAKDPENYENVKRLAQKQGSQIVFVLTGTCDGTDEVYYLLAKDTGGQVFHLDRRDEVGKILDYVRQQVSIRPTVVATHEFLPGTHKFDLNVDSAMKELVISVSGTDPSVSVVGPTGEKKPTEDIVRTRNVAIVKVMELTPGKYTTVVSSSTKNSVVVTAGTTLHFQHGFSILYPRSINDTTTKPIPDEESYVSIKLNIEGTDEITLDKVQIMDMDNTVIMERPLEIEDEMNKFYVAKNPIIPPTKTFRIAIKGRDVNGKEITRISLTPLEPQFRASAIPYKAPVVSIVGDNKVIAEYQQYLQLKCLVSGHPRPDVMWESTAKTKLKSELSLVELPSDYISVLTIDRVINNETYTCRAFNTYGESSKDIDVETIKNEYFNILKRPKSAIVELDHEAQFECEMDANPPVNITWYRNREKVEENENVDISDSGATLVFKSMQPGNVGRYHCKVDNINVHKRFWFHVRVSGTEAPMISKSQSQIQVQEGEDVRIKCEILKGRPQPLIYWFYKHKATGVEKKLYGPEHDDEIYIPKVDSTNSGTYRCEAHNDIGMDYHNVELIIGHSPVLITNKNEHITVKDGEKIKLPCIVTGEPTPDIKWFHKDTDLSTSKRYLIESTGLGFKATISDAGTYVCLAENDYGTVNKSIHLDVVIPPLIEIPKETTFKIEVGEYLALPCRADGYPSPRLEWKYNSLNTKLPSREIRASDPSQLILTRIQVAHQGLYTCVASNAGGSERITYTVLVLAPPNIETVNPKRPFIAVDGDLVLRVPCKATGIPEPKITWKHGSEGVPSRSDWYDIEDDGTLVIKTPDKKSAGTYTCYAENDMGVDAEIYEVIIEAYPATRAPKTSVVLKEGNSTALECDVPTKATDYVRWFKDGLLLSEEKTYRIVDAKISDSGIYTCRVSDFTKSQSGHINVSVGSAPKFVYTKVETTIFYEDGAYSEDLDCTATGYPEPEVSWWHDGVKMPVKDMVHKFTMTLKDRGIYVCLVNNKFGSIIREFAVVSQDCVLNVWSELKDHQPLMISAPDNTWPSFDSDDGFLNIASGEYIRLACPTGFENFPDDEIFASCLSESNFASETDGPPHKFSDFRCKSEVEVITKVTDKNCLPANRDAKFVKVGYESLGDFLEVYEVCLDIRKKAPVYAKHLMHHSLSNVIPETKRTHFSDLVRADTSSYDCKQEKYASYTTIGRWFNRKDDCCFSKRLLVDPKDVFPGLPQMATFSNLNTVPHWSNCNSVNWEKVEDAVRTLVRSTGAELTVSTGVAYPINTGTTASVSRYLWKVVQNPMTKQSLAIIQLNLPDVTSRVATINMFCKDICKEITWLNSDSFHDVNKGFTFCCNIIEFENKLKYQGVFDRGSGKVLYDTSSIPEYYSALD